jgi:hypothetical protein
MAAAPVATPAYGVMARTPLNAYSPLMISVPDQAQLHDVDREPDTVTLSGSFAISNKELRKQADKGRALELRFGDGIERIEFSNPMHTEANFKTLPKGVNVLKGVIRFQQENNAGTPLLMSVNVPAPGTMLEHGSSAKEPHAPNGMLTIQVPNKMEAKVERKLTPEARLYLIKYPGQTAEDQDRMAPQVANDPKTAHVQVHDPPAYTIEYYNAHPEVVKSRKMLGLNGQVPVDERGRSYADHAIIAEVKEKAKADIRKGVTHCNLFTNDFVVRVWPPDMKKRVDGKTKDVPGSLANVHAEAVSRIPDGHRVLADSEFHITYSITLPFITSAPNFE